MTLWIAIGLAAAGAGLFPHLVEDSLMGFIEQSSRFLAPVYAGDTLYAAHPTLGYVPRPGAHTVTLPGGHAFTATHDEDGWRVTGPGEAVVDLSLTRE